MDQRLLAKPLTPATPAVERGEKGWRVQVVGLEMAAAGHHNRVTDVETVARLPPISEWEDQPVVS